MLLRKCTGHFSPCWGDGPDRVVRFTFKWSDPNGKELTQAGMQSYRIEDGKLAETWIVLSRLARRARQNPSRELDQPAAIRIEGRRSRLPGPPLPSFKDTPKLRPEKISGGQSFHAQRPAKWLPPSLRS